MIEGDDPFDILGVATDASDAEVKAAYYERSKETHSDRGGSDDEFVRVRKAYDSIRDAGDRRVAAEARAALGNPFSVFDEAFETMAMAEAARTPSTFKKGADVHKKLFLTLEQAFLGGAFPLVGPPMKCGVCRGTGVLGVLGEKRQCGYCGGGGSVWKWRGSVSVEPGIASGIIVRVDGGGLPPPTGRGRPGDLYVEIAVERHADLGRSGR